VGGGEKGTYVAGKAEERRGASRTEDLANGNDEVLAQDVCECRREIRVIKNATKGCVDIIAVAKNVFVGTSKSHAPEGREEPRPGGTIEDGRTCVRIGDRGLFNRRVDRSRLVRAGVGTVNADATLPFLDNPE
jgi:hypothetical protein